MKKSLIALAVLASLGAASASSYRGRARTLDVAFTYRMGAGYPGDVNRLHPASIVPGLQDPANPVRLYGDPVLVGANNAYRGYVVGDTTAAKIKGVLVRPANIQQTAGGMSAAFGVGAPPVTAGTVFDVIEDGHVMVKCNNAAAGQPTKGSGVYVWFGASAGNDVQGGFTGRANASAILLTNAEWTGPVDANGIGEIRVWKQ